MKFNYARINHRSKIIYSDAKQIAVGTYKVVTNKYLIALSITILAVFILNAFFEIYRLRTPVIVKFQAPIEVKDIEYINPRGGIETGDTNVKGEVTVTEEDFETDVMVLNTFIGKASYYSKDGCVGCNANQIMANGEVFNENDYTLAFNKLPLNTLVRVTNTETGIRAIARVTDRGGFEKYGRIADLSKALAEEIELETDQTVIRIEELPVNTGENR